MGKLVFEGDDKQLQKIAKSSRLIAKKHGLKVSLDIKEVKPKTPVKKTQEKKASPIKKQTSNSKK